LNLWETQKKCRADQLFRNRGEINFLLTEALRTRWEAKQSIGRYPVTSLRLFSVLALSAALSVFGTVSVLAQSLSDSTLALSSNVQGYMGLGGNLGKAIVDRHKARQAKAPKPTNVERRTAARTRPGLRAEKAHVSNANTQSQIYLIAQSLDHTGLNIASITTSTQGP
jgi:hypothetical protein